MKRRKFTWLRVTILMGIIQICTGIKEECKCTNYDDLYMLCDCCPEETGYIFNISYFYYNWNPPSPVRKCEDNRSSESVSFCDCVYCGIVNDKSNPFWKTCFEMEDRDKDFWRSSTYNLTVSYTYYDSIVIKSYHYVVTANDSILLPSAPTFEDWTSYLQADESVAMDVWWKPIRELDRKQLNYTIKWKSFGGNNAEMVGHTEDRNLTLTGLHPNTPYHISITCKHPASPYESESVEMIVRSAEKRPDKAPELVNFQMSEDCNDENWCNITLLWKSIPREYQSANCTEYSLGITGDQFAFNQSVDCNDVMTVINEPLSRTIGYDVMLYYLSNLGSSPPSHLKIPAQADVNGLGRPNLIIERNQSRVSVDVRWDHEGEPPTRYELTTCQGTAVDKCQANVMKETLEADDFGNAILWINNPGDGFLYNIAPYWENLTPGLEDNWLCVFDACGDLLPPELGLTDVQEAKSLSIIIKEARCTPLQKDRGRALFYLLEWQEEDSEEVFQEEIEAFGPVTYTLEELNADQFYAVRVRSQGCNKQSSWSARSFKTSEETWYLFPPWAIAVVVISIILLILASVGSGGWYYKRRRNDVEKSLKKRDDDRSVVSWLEKGDFANVDEDYAQIDPTVIVNQSMYADSDSGVHDDGKDGGASICCSCFEHKEKKRTLSESKTQDVEIMAIRKKRGSHLSIPSNDSGHSEGGSEQGSPPDQEIVLHVNNLCAVDRNVGKDNRVTSSLPSSDCNQPGSAIPTYACQASPMSSTNEAFSSSSDGKGVVKEQGNSNCTKVKANTNANADKSGNDNAFEARNSSDDPQGFIPKVVSVPGIDFGGYSMTSDDEENKTMRAPHLKKDSIYLPAFDLKDSSPSCGSVGDCSIDTSECTEDTYSNSDDDVFVPVVRTILNSPDIVKDGNKDNVIVTEQRETDNEEHRSPVTCLLESETLDLPTSQDEPKRQFDCSDDMDYSPKQIQQIMPDEVAENSNSCIDISDLDGVIDTQCEENPNSLTFDSRPPSSTNQSHDSDNDSDDDSDNDRDDDLSLPDVITVKLPTGSNV